MSLTTNAINQWGLPMLDDPGPLGTMILARRQAGMDAGTVLPDRVTPATWLRWLAAVRRGEADIISVVNSLGRRAHVLLQGTPGESAITNDAIRRHDCCADDYLVAEIAWEAIRGRDRSGYSAPPMPSDYGADLDQISARAGFRVSPPMGRTP